MVSDVADDEPCIQYKPTSEVLHILPSAELKQLDKSQSLSMSDTQLGCASLTICPQTTQTCCLIVKII